MEEPSSISLLLHVSPVAKRVKAEKFYLGAPEGRRPANPGKGAAAPCNPACDTALFYTAAC